MQKYGFDFAGRLPTEDEPSHMLQVDIDIDKNRVTLEMDGNKIPLDLVCTCDLSSVLQNAVEAEDFKTAADKRAKDYIRRCVHKDKAEGLL